MTRAVLTLAMTLALTSPMVPAAATPPCTPTDTAGLGGRAMDLEIDGRLVYVANGSGRRRT